MAPKAVDKQKAAAKKADAAKKAKARARACSGAQRRGSRDAARVCCEVFARRLARVCVRCGGGADARLRRGAAAAQNVEDKTFGLKNKNKSAKVQKCAPPSPTAVAPLTPRSHPRTPTLASRQPTLSLSRAASHPPTPRMPRSQPLSALPCPAPSARSYVETMKKSLESGNKNATRLALADPNSKEAKAVRTRVLCHACACVAR
jgi:hypothetical protein